MINNCEFCNGVGATSFYLIDENMETYLHPGCARVLRTEVSVELIEEGY